MRLLFLLGFVVLALVSAYDLKALNPHISVVERAIPSRIRRNADPAPASVPAQRLTRSLPVLSSKFSRALPLNPPVPRNADENYHRPRNPTPSNSCLSQTKQGHILAIDIATTQQVGFIRLIPNSFKEYGLTQDISAALSVSFTTTCPSKPFCISATNSVIRPFLGGAIGFASSSASFSAGSANYAYLTGTEQTSSGAPPSNVGNSFTDVTHIPERSESAIWSYNPVTMEITPQWVNTDSSLPVTYIGYTQDILVLAGDKTSFTNTFGPTQFLQFFFVAA